MCTLSVEQQTTKELAARLAREYLAPVAAELDMSEEHALEILLKIGRAGFFGLAAPPMDGSSPPDTLSLVLVLEELAKGSASMALCCLAHTTACRAIANGGTDLLKERLLTQLTQGTKSAALAVHEAGSGAVSALIETRAARQGDTYVVNGSKVFATNGAYADYFVTLVRTGPDKDPGSTSFLVMERETGGFTQGTHHRRMGLNGTGSRELFFDGCRVPAGNRLQGKAPDSNSF